MNSEDYVPAIIRKTLCEGPYPKRRHVAVMTVVTVPYNPKYSHPKDKIKTS
jgi:hypothetical protein